MKKISLIVFLSFALAGARGDDLTTTDGKTYATYTVTSHDDNGITIWYKEGQATIPYGNLPANLQKQYGYTAKVSELETDYQGSLAAAKDQKKLVLLHFTGSDWCPYCQLLDKEVLSTPAFKSYAGDKFLCVTLDYPNSIKLPAKVVQQNKELQKQFHVHSFPTLIVVDTEGKELSRLTGYNPGGGLGLVMPTLKKGLKETPAQGTSPTASKTPASPGTSTAAPAAPGDGPDPM